MKKHIRYSFLAMAMLSAMSFTACEDAIEIGGTIDETPYQAAQRLDGLLLDQNTNQNSSVVELTGDESTTPIVFRLTKAPTQDVNIQVSIDEDYTATYNSLHGTDFEMYPSTNVAIGSNGTFVLTAGEQSSTTINATLTAFDGMKEDQTYIVPLAVTTTTEGVTLSETSSHMVLLVKDYRNRANTDKGEDAVKTVLYFEVNDTNPLNALEFKTASGKYFFDHVVIFSANINWSDEEQRVYVSNNENVQYLLDHNDELLQPLRKAGMKVIMCILGNNDESGVAQLSDMGAKEFARELAAYCRTYNLDGVTFDDEYSNSPDLNNPWLTRRSYAAASRLVYECKQAMPEKIVSVFSYSYMSVNGFSTIEGVTPGQYCDYAVSNYGSATSPATGMTKKQCSGMSIELNLGYGNASESTARSRKESGYGYYMFFALDPSKYTTKSQVYKCQTVCRGLYEEELISPQYYYPKNSTERTLLN